MCIRDRDVEVQFTLRGQKLTAIRNGSLAVYPEETLAIVGESGCGKSVFTKCFVGMLDNNGSITNGSIMFDGKEPVSYTHLVVQTITKGGFWDHVGTAYTVFVRAVPALVSYSLILVFGSRLLHLPSMYSTRDVLRSSILPVVCLSLGSVAGHMVWTRRYMVDELNKDYIRLAKLKGMSTKSVMYKHVLKNAFVPMAQYLPQSVLAVTGGSLLVERFFSVPGLGTLLTDAILRYDLNVVQVLVMMYASMGIVGVFLGDVLMTVLDPRIRLTGKESTR